MFPAEGFQPTLAKLVAVLDRFQIRFHLTGGITSVVYGEPRMTQDLDLVLDRVLAVQDELLDALSSAGFHSRPDAALSKLIWIRHGSHRSRRDLSHILAGATSDELGTVRGTATKMGLAGLLTEVLVESDEIDV